MNKTGKIVFNLHYPDGNHVFAVKKVGTYNIKNGKCNFKFKMTNEEYVKCDLSVYPISVLFEFIYYNKENKKECSFFKDVYMMTYDDILPSWTLFPYYGIGKVSTSISGNSIVAYKGKVVSFKGSVVDEWYTPVKEGRVIIKLDGMPIKSDIYLKSSNHFIYNYTIPDNVSKKKYRISYIFMGSKDYKKSEINKTLIITKIPTKIITKDLIGYAGQKINFHGKLFDSNNKPIKTGSIVIKLNGKTVTSNITLRNSNKFNYKYTIPGYQAKNYTITFVYKGDKEHK
ncbi:hypothetical protein PXD04_04000 [Methanosphaera sp. ISO3-F5]|uniref:hypothetical protein n=1 Tax=Methanosphaera sp. ISO3-F5 TaxID=1452353 RepID=UPI002B262267|nr:hypothetical protein [Methanosphaera sp. ISO3-F5]WQH64954.1 hypothetical protein PXD04_04000 [Methanosphaera sp. ISO3-F5]